MTILKILQYPDLRLRRKAAPVTDVHDTRIKSIISDMLETLSATPDCAALAATQLDVDNPPKITVLTPIAGLFNEPLCLINPEITEKSGSTRIEEGCMSVYPQKISALVDRAATVKVTALNRQGHHIEINAEQLFAKCLQHEIDHLHGVIYLDYLSQLKLALLKKKIAKLQLYANSSTS